VFRNGASGQQAHDGRPASLRATLESAVQELSAGARLTPRQIQVLTCLARGMRSKAIAAELGIDYRTVAEHITRACTRLGVADVDTLRQRLVAAVVDLATRTNRQ
jgi:DNA-binding NarL/FixJ family response regulator